MTIYDVYFSGNKMWTLVDYSISGLKKQIRKLHGRTGTFVIVYDNGIDWQKEIIKL